MAKPRVTGTTHELPFEKLSPRDFERMCLWLVRREGYPTAEHHGAAGSDRGRDLVAQREEGITAFQCKRVKEFGPAKAEDAVKKIMAEGSTPTEIILLIACDVRADTREKAAEMAGEIPCVVWARTELDERVNRHPEVVEEFFALTPPRSLTPYLERLMRQAGELTLSGVDPAVAVGDADAALKLDAVYTALLTNLVDVREFDEGHAADFHKVSALELLNLHQRLVLLGDPGSGKSTFVNFVALCMAGEIVGSERVGLNLLTAPLPDEQGQDQEERQPWDHGALLPLRIVLRDFAARGLPAAGAPCTARHLWAHVEGELEEAALGELAQPLKHEIQSRGGLVLLDGLDEVPEAEGRRKQILQAVADFAKTFSRCRFLVTCRTYAYQHQRWRLPDFQTASLAPLGDGQVRRFVSRWYQHIAVLRQLARDDARGRAALLEAAIFGSERLRSLAETPLLLTLMASLHAWREGSLPERREELYADAVNLLLNFWERKRVVLGASGEPVVQQPSLAEWLRTDRASVRRLLNELAFRAHAEQPELVGTADVPEEKLVAGLLKISGNLDARPGRLVEYLCDRAGLLLSRGAEVFTFPPPHFPGVPGRLPFDGRRLPRRDRSPGAGRAPALARGHAAGRRQGGAGYLRCRLGSRRFTLLSRHHRRGSRSGGCSRRPPRRPAPGGVGRPRPRRGAPPPKARSGASLAGRATDRQRARRPG